MEPREDGVEVFYLDKCEILIFWARWLNSNGNDAIIRRVKRDRV
jgi:trehalose utilization protein